MTRTEIWTAMGGFNIAGKRPAPLRPLPMPIVRKFVEALPQDKDSKR
jgi:hypothetical protein